MLYVILISSSRVKYEYFDGVNQTQLTIESPENFTDFERSIYVSLNSFANCMKCFEFLLHQGNNGGYHIIGFKTETKMFSFYTYNLSSQFMNAGINDTYRPNITKTEYNKRYMLCINSFAQRIYFITENQTYANKIKIDKDERIRIEFANGRSKFNIDTVDLFFGKEEFINEIPYGFVPWISKQMHNLSKICLTNQQRRASISRASSLMFNVY